MAPFIVFEGIDGSGKSTQAYAFHQALLKKGYDAILTREPGGTPLGETIAHWLKTVPERTNLSELFLFAASRAQHVSQLIKPSLAKGKVVVCDRFTASTLAYQGYGRGLDLSLIRRVNADAAAGLEPTLTVLLDAPVEVIVHRKKGTKQDVIESSGREFLQRVRDGYLALAEESPESWVVVDGRGSREEVAEKVRKAVDKTLTGMA
ncbi:MAG: dTMP kinase [SAR202 cluster bacterium]|nr:dTMP kinase [SAR202 cluster bacterium]